MPVLHSILVPVDGSPPSIAALDHAVALANDHDSSVELLEVIPAAEPLTPSARLDAMLTLDDGIERARVALGPRISGRTVFGDPVAKIVEVARTGFDLIVIGTHGWVGRLHELLGSVAEGVVRNAPCPVLTVRTPDRGYQSFAEHKHNRPTVGERRMATRVERHIEAPPSVVYDALLDRNAVATWMVPGGMTSHVHAFEPREGGLFRISLVYDQPGPGKTDAQTDTFHGRFVELVPGQHVEEVVEFETSDPAFRGESTISITLAEAGAGTDLIAVHDHLPPGLSARDNEVGWRSSLAKLASLVETG